MTSIRSFPSPFNEINVDNNALFIGTGNFPPVDVEPPPPEPHANTRTSRWCRLLHASTPETLT